MKDKLDLAIKVSILTTIALFPLSTVLGYAGIGLTLLLTAAGRDLPWLLQLAWRDKPLLLVIGSFSLAIGFSKLFYLSAAIGLFVSGQLILYLLVRAYLRDAREIKQAILLTLAVSILISGIGIYQYYFGNPNAIAQGWLDASLYSDIQSRVFSTLYNPNVLGSYLIFIIATAFGCLDFADRKLGIFLAAVFSTALMCLLFTYSRGAWLGLAVSILVMVGLRRDKKYILGLLTGAALILAVDFRHIWERLNPLVLQHDTSTAYRMEIWRTSLKIFQDHPFWGTGMGTVWYYIPQYSQSIYTFIAHSHNLYLQLAVEGGFFGLVSFLILVGTMLLMNFDVFRKSRSRRQRGIALGLLAGFIGFMVQGFVDAAIVAPQFGMLFWVYSGLSKNLWELGKRSMAVEPEQSPRFLRLRSRPEKEVLAVSKQQ